MAYKPKPNALTPAERGAMGGTKRWTENPRYTPAERERGMHAVAMLGSTGLAAQETGITQATLKEWTQRSHAVRYHEIREQVMPQIHAQIAAESEDLARKYAALENRGLDDLHRDWDQLRPNEKAQALSKLPIAKGIAIDKALTLRGQPTQIVQHDVQGDLRVLASAGIVDIADVDVQPDEEGEAA